MYNRAPTRTLAALIAVSTLLLTPAAQAQVGVNITHTAVGLLPQAWQSSWARLDLESLIAAGLLPETRPASEGFSPAGAITAADAAEFLLLMASAPQRASGTLLDQAVARGLIAPEDFGSGQVEAGAAVRRELYALWTARAIGSSMLVEQSEILLHPNFLDADQISSELRNAVAHLQEKGILAGDGTGRFHPSRSLTRAEAIRILTTVRLRGEKAAPAPAPDPANAAYRVEGQTITLAAGKSVTAVLRDLRASGDLNGDGLADTAVLLTVQPGGSGSFTYLAICC